MKPNTIVLGFYDSHQPIDLLMRYLFILLMYSINLVNLGVSISFHAQCSDPTLRRADKTVHLQAEQNLYPVRGADEARVLSADEYVSIIADIVRLQKNICLCRHFHSLDLNHIQRSV